VSVATPDRRPAAGSAMVRSSGVANGGWGVEEVAGVVCMDVPEAAWGLSQR
jgi:hypothetical protein